MADTDEKKHQAGGPGKAAKEGHIDPSKRNKPGQNQRGPRTATKSPALPKRGERVRHG